MKSEVVVVVVVAKDRRGKGKKGNFVKSERS